MSDDIKQDNPSTIMQRDNVNRWYHVENGEKHELPKLPILLGDPNFYPPGTITMPNGSQRQVFSEPVVLKIPERY